MAEDTDETRLKKTLIMVEAGNGHMVPFGGAHSSLPFLCFKIFPLKRGTKMCW